jgi:antitoxin component of MazEF toxin-antitoxin module
MIRRKFRQIGNSWGIILPRMILESLKINPVLYDLDLEIENDRIILKKLKRED